MGIEIDISFSDLWDKFLALGSQDPAAIATQLFFHGGWVILLIIFTYGLYHFWLDGRQGQFAGKWKWVILAIDIPKNNEQTPKAVENIFASLAGAYTSGNLFDIHWRGKVTESFSFEVVGLEGYVQFLIRTPTHFRDLVEAAIYAQYPEAEITEVEDYAAPYKGLHFPNDQYNLWGTEFVLTKDYPYPIRTYPQFEHPLTGYLIDPMAGLLEALSRFGPGEQVWLQIIVTPRPPDWGEKAKKILKKLMGQPYVPPETILDKALIKPVSWVGDKTSSIVSSILAGGEAGAEVKKEEDQWKMFKMSPGERLVFENIQKKMAKLPFRVKIRMIYLAEKEIFAKGKGVAPIVGAIQQFNVPDANGFKPGKRTKTAADYFNVAKRVAWRQNRILRLFIGRSNYYGEDVSNMILSTEELASLWHFPVIAVKTPTLERVGYRKSVPPTRLPYETRLPFRNLDGKEKARPAAPVREEKAEPPSPFVSETEWPAENEKREEKTETVKRPAPPANLPTV